MDSSEGRYGWAADDPRWTDAQAGGRGRLDPPPPPLPSFADADTVVGGIPPVGHHAPYTDDAQTETLPAWPGRTPPGGPAPEMPGTPATPALRRQGSTAARDERGADRAEPRDPVRAGHGLTSAAPSGVPAVAGDHGAPAQRIDRRVQARRRRADDEFRAAGRAELFSDEARYIVLFTLTAIWYAPFAVLTLVWILIVNAGEGPTGQRLLSGVLWLVAAAALSLGVVGLLRWARVGWRALTLSIAAALIGGGVVTIAHTLSG